MGVLERGGEWIRAHPLAGDIAVAVGLTPLTVWTTYLLCSRGSEAWLIGSIAVRPPWFAVVVPAVLLAQVSVVARRVRPAMSFVLVGTTTALQLLTSIWFILPSVLVVVVSLYSFTAYGGRNAPMIGLLAGACGSLLVTVGGFLASGRPTVVTEMLFHAMVRLLPFLIAAWSLGMFQRMRLAYVSELEGRAARAEAEREERARRAVTEERARIAREIHDVVAHALSVVISQAQGGRYAARARPDRAVEVLSTIATTGRQALADMRGMLEILRAGGADHEDRFPQPTLAELPDLLEGVRAAGVRVDFVERGAPCPLGAVAELSVFRLVQEALTNTIKHAGEGARAEVCFTWSSDELAITVTDDGKGPTAGTPGHGLVGMRERLAVVGGSVMTGPADNGGFRVAATLPTRTEGAPS